jgi:hypothetical protein
MTDKTTRLRRWLVLPAVVAAALAVGAVLGNAHSGSAATQSAPTNTALPKISGGTREGRTLTASKGTWTGNPTSFTYAWSRCDARGKNCTVIGGATSSTYVTQAADVGSTIRVTVTAKNADGSASATSLRTGVIQGTNGCPAGSGAINVAALTPPARLNIGQPTITPNVITRSTQSAQLRFQITACNGRPVQGASLFAPAIPYNQFTALQGTSDANGFVTGTVARQSGFPASRRQHLLTVFARASKPGEPILAGVSTRRLFTFPVNLG